MANGGVDDDVQVRSITFNCESASIMVDINHLSVNVCHNELVSLYSGALLEDLCHNFGRKSMIKRSLLLIKSWCCYDSSQYSAGRDARRVCFDFFQLENLCFPIYSRQKFFI